MNTGSHIPTGATLSVPVHLVEQFRGHRMVVRSDDPRSFPNCLEGDCRQRIEYLQLTDLEAEPSPLVKWECVFPIDLVMTVPAREFSRLYAFSSLLDRGPVRVSIPVADGMENAVKLAASLHFSVRIIPGQPDRDEVTQLIRLMDFYLKNPIIAEPIEFFHSLFFAVVKGEAATLWEILEKDPTRYRFVTDEGRIDDSLPCPISLPISSADTGAELKADTMKAAYLQRQEGVHWYTACIECTYFRWCRGFFKYPASDYSCTTVFPLFDHLFAGAAELKQDLSAKIPGASS